MSLPNLLKKELKILKTLIYKVNLKAFKLMEKFQEFISNEIIKKNS